MLQPNIKKLINKIILESSKEKNLTKLKEEILIEIKIYQPNLIYFLFDLYNSDKTNVMKFMEIFEEELLYSYIELYFNDLKKIENDKTNTYNEFTNKFCSLSIKNIKNEQIKKQERMKKFILDIYNKYKITNDEKTFLFQTLEAQTTSFCGTLKLSMNNKEIKTDDLYITHYDLYKSIFDLIYEVKEKHKKLKESYNKSIDEIYKFKVRLELDIPEFEFKIN